MVKLSLLKYRTQLGPQDYEVFKISFNDLGAHGEAFIAGVLAEPRAE